MVSFVSTKVLVTATLSLGIVVCDVYEIYTSQDYAVMACSGVIEATTTFCSKKAHIVGNCYCASVPEMGSLLTCLHDMGYYNDKMVAYLGDACTVNYPNTTLDAQFFDAVYQNASKYIITPPADMNATLISYSPITVKPKKVEAYYQSYYNRWNNFTLALNLGAGFIALVTLFMVVSGIANWAVLLCPRLVMRLNGSFSKALKRHITLPAMHSTNKNVPPKLFGLPHGLLPTRAESLIIFSFWVYMILGSSIGFHHVSGNPIWKRPMGEIGRLVADRAGMLALFVYPMSILFASRNNVLMFFTRWSYARFNTLHRHMARIFFALVITHGTGMTINSFGISSTKYKTRLQEGYILWGVVAAIFMGFMLVQSILVLRRKSYEAFLMVHILFAIVIMIGIHYHINSFGYQGFTWVTIGIWGLDRVIRWGRMFSFGVNEASVTLVAGETLRVTVSKPKHWNSQPGQHAFVSFMMPACFWQSHPFTAISSNENELSFAIKVKGGVTSSLYKHLVSMPSQTATIKVCVEGPYGFSSPTQKYSQSLLMASGNGIPGMYDHAMRLANTSSKHSVKLVWVVRSYKPLSWMYEEMKKLGDTKVETIMYVTRPDDSLDYTNETNASDSENKSGEGKDEANEKSCLSRVQRLQKGLPHIEFKEGRPDIDCVIKEEFTQAGGSVAVVACGHDSMVDAIRYAVVHNLDATSHRVDYFEELQVWA